MDDTLYIVMTSWVWMSVYSVVGESGFETNRMLATNQYITKRVDYMSWKCMYNDQERESKWVVNGP